MSLHLHYQLCQWLKNLMIKINQRSDAVMSSVQSPLSSSALFPAHPQSILRNCSFNKLSKKDSRVNLYGDKDVADEIFLKYEETSLKTADSSPFCDKLLQRVELLWRDHEAKRLDHNNFSSRQEEESAFDDVIEMKRKIHTLTTENSHLKKLLAAKEELAKENAFLRYEYTVLEKKLEVKTEETEHTRKSMELTHKQQLRNVNKIVELEAECKRLRLLFRKKFPDRSISMRNEGEEMKRRNANNKSDLMMRDEAQIRKLKYDMSMEQIGNVRAENKNLMDIIIRKNMETKDLSRGQQPLSDVRSENSVISSPYGSKEMMKLLIDDFNEMEKLAIFCSEKAPKEDDEKEDGSFDWIQVVLSAISLGCMDDDDDDGETKNPLCITWKSNVKSGPMTKNEIKRHLGLAKADKVETDKSRELKEIDEGDLDTKLHIAEAKLNETQKKLSSLEVEFDYRKSCCEELEGTCIELQLQLESVETKKPMRRNKTASVKLSLIRVSRYNNQFKQTTKSFIDNGLHIPPHSSPLCLAHEVSTLYSSFAGSMYRILYYLYRDDDT
ncbi:hypothetical protein Bca101_084157 [Brassica carinata]